MKDRVKNVITIILSITIGVIGTLITLKYCGFLEKEEGIKNVTSITLSESDTLKSSIDKVYNSVVYIESSKNNRTSGSGSGFVYKKDDKYGYILTNNHVIDGANKVDITNIEGKIVEASVLGSDEYTDIAVLKIDAEDVLQVAEFGNSEESNLGDTIFTVGSPLGKDYMGTVTKGILSGKNRAVTIDSSYVMEVLQVDAALNPGNSGGPLVNINGEVIGINSLKLVENEIEGMGFAIPIELVKTMVDKLEKGESIERPVLGVSMLNIDNQYLLYKNGIVLDSTIDSGVVIVEVEKKLPAGRANLQKGDVILEINNEEVKNVAYFKSILYKYSVGDTITVKYLRNNKINEVKIKLDMVLEDAQ